MNHRGQPWQAMASPIHARLCGVWGSWLRCPARNGLILFLAVAMGSCLDAPGVPCGDGFCPAGYECWRDWPAFEDICLKFDARPGICGNHLIEIGEGCDDGNTSPGDGCDPFCALECGNGSHDSGEECDDGNRYSGDGCSEHCTMEVCGNGQVDANEECDCGEALTNGFCLWPPSQDGSPPTDVCNMDCTLQDEPWIPPDRRLRSEHQDHGTAARALRDTRAPQQPACLPP